MLFLVFVRHAARPHLILSTGWGHFNAVYVLAAHEGGGVDLSGAPHLVDHFFYATCLSALGTLATHTHVHHVDALWDGLWRRLWFGDGLVESVGTED